MLLRNGTYLLNFGSRGGDRGTLTHAGECARVLKQRSMTRVRVDDELGIGQMRAESKRVDGRDHRIVVPIRDKYRLRNLL